MPPDKAIPHMNSYFILMTTIFQIAGNQDSERILKVLCLKQGFSIGDSLLPEGIIEHWFGKDSSLCVSRSVCLSVSLSFCLSLSLSLFPSFSLPFLLSPSLPSVFTFYWRTRFCFEGCYWHLTCREQGLAKYSTMHKTAPSPRTVSLQMSTRLRLKNLTSRREGQGWSESLSSNFWRAILEQR